MDIDDGAWVASIDNFKMKFHVLPSFLAWEEKPEITIKVYIKLWLQSKFTI